MKMTLHTFSDKSTLSKVNARELANIPVWKGNRFIDIEHANKIREAISDNIQMLDSSVFRTVCYMDGNVEQRFLVDGQHRQYVLKKFYEENQLFPPNFDVLVIEKTVDTEADAIEYFNILNNVKPQQDSDPKLMANKYILALTKQFPKLIRPEGKATKRPFLSSDALRKTLEANAQLLKQRPEAVKAFVQRVVIWNSMKLRECELFLTQDSCKEKSVMKSCTDKGFILAFDQTLPWVKLCL